MTCPYCRRLLFGQTGVQEAQKFRAHLARCQKNPNNFVVTDGQRTAVVPKAHQDLRDALQIRADSGQ